MTGFVYTTTTEKGTILGAYSNAERAAKAALEHVTKALTVEEFSERIRKMKRSDRIYSSAKVQNAEDKKVYAIVAKLKVS